MEEVIIFNDGKLSIVADRPQRYMQKITFKYNGRTFKFPHAPSIKIFTGAEFEDGVYTIFWETKDSWHSKAETELYVRDGWLYYLDLGENGTLYRAVQKYSSKKSKNQKA